MDDTPPAPRRPRRLLRRLLLAGTGLAGLVAAGPWLASRTPLPEYAARQALADFRGSVHVGGTSLNWFTPQEITGLEVRDAAGRPLLIAPRVTLSRSLAGLLLDRSDLGTVRVEGAELHVEAEGATTNLEAALAAYLRPSTGESRPGPAGAPLPAVRVECIGAKLTVADGGKEWAVGPADVTAVLPRDPAERVSVTVKSATPRLDLDACLARDGSAGTVKLSAEGLPLAPGGVFLRRFDPAAGLDGSLTATLDGEWTGADWRAEGKVAVAGLDVAGPWLADPRLRLGSVEVPVKAACKSGRLTVERAEVVTDLGRASLSGSAEPAAGLAGLARAELRLSASADLARVAAILPKTLRLRDGLTVTGGTVQLDARAEGPALTASLHTASLAAVLDGQPIEWPQPLVAELTAHRAGEGLPVVDRLRCESEGVKLEAAGTAERLTATAEADLGRLRTHLARFADLGAIRFAGTATARVTAGRGPGDALTASGTVAARGLRLSGPTGKEWVEDACSARFELTGKLPDAGPLTVASASMAFTAAGDEASAELLAPLTVPGPMSASARVRLTGELARWRARVAPWADLTGLEPAGVADLSACISAGADAFTADEARASVRGFRFRGYGLTLDEPTLTASAATARYELATGEVSLTRPALICPTATATFAALRMTPRGQFIGTGDVSADLARVQRLAMTPTPKGPDALGGKAAGRVELAAGGDGQGVSADLACTDVTVGDPAAPLWKDPTSRALVRGVFAPDWDALRLDEFRLETPALGAVGKGAVGKLCTRQELALTGDFRYDLAKLGPQLRPYLGSMEVTGSGTRPFRIGGTTTAPAAELGAGWESVKGYGCVVGPATVDARLAGDWLRVTPFETTINGGKARFQPALRLSAGEVLVGPERIDRAKLTPATCSELIGYAAPLLANVAEADGEFTVAIDAGRLPLAAPTKADVAGRLTLHAARVTGNPLVRELAGVLKLPAGVAVVRDSEVPFRLVEGRVHHQNLMLDVGGTTVRSSGSVGLDGTLGLLIEFPAPAHLVGGPVGTAVARQTIRLPVGGTLARPRIDDTAFRKVIGQAAKEAAEDALRREAEKQLHKLLPLPPKK